MASNTQSMIDCSSAIFPNILFRASSNVYAYGRSDSLRDSVLARGREATRLRWYTNAAPLSSEMGIFLLSSALFAE